MTSTSAPKGLKPAGRRLWRSGLAAFELAEHELSLLRQACAVADLCEGLQVLVDQDGSLLDGKVHPALVELRLQRILLARLVVALRVPMGDQEEASNDRSGRLQHRGTRGVYGIRGGAA